MAHSPPIIYLDYNATTPVAPEVLVEMLPFFTKTFGNPASRDHLQGWLAREAVDQARETVAKAIGAAAHEITFTAGATESINLLIQGLHNHHSTTDLPILTLTTEHKAVLEACKMVEGKGRRVIYQKVNPDGLVDVLAWEKALQAGAMLACILWVNNETGVMQDLPVLDKLCQQYGVPLFLDATQALGKIPVDLKQFPAVHYAAFSGHKIYGPKGVGALFQREGSTLPNPLIVGGGQEKGIRAGTLNVPGIVGFAAAAKLSSRIIQPETVHRISGLRDQLEQELLSLANVSINGSTQNRVPHVTNLQFSGILAEELIMAVNHRLAISTGSACNSLRVDPSHVLMAMGKTSSEAFSSLRFSLGHMTTEGEITTAVEVLKEAIRQLN